MNVLKNLFLLVATTSAASNMCLAQNYSITPNDTFWLAGQMEDFQTLTITQHNTSGKTITLTWRKVSESIPSKWDALVCDNQVCYATLVDSGTMNPILPNDSAFLFVKITGHVNYGTAVIRYALWDIDNPALKDTLTFILTIDKISAIEKGMDKYGFSS